MAVPVEEWVGRRCGRERYGVTLLLSAAMLDYVNTHGLDLPL